MMDRRRMAEMEDKLFAIIKESDCTFTQVLGVLENLKFRLRDKLDELARIDREKTQKLLK